MNDGLIPYIIVMVVLIILSAYFSATETAFSSLNRTRLRTIADKGNRRAALALDLAEHYDKLISTILVGNNIVNIALASIGTVLFVRLYGDIGATVSTVVITVAVLIFGEVTPKSIAKDCPERFAMFSAPFMRLLIWILTPINFLFSGWKKLVARVLKLETDSKMSQEELLMFVDEVQQDGSIDTNEGELLRNAIGFTDREAADILTHRVDIEAVPIDADKHLIARTFTESKFSRLLVYDGDIDNIVGVIHQKDFYTDGGITPREIRNIIAPAVFVLKSENIDSVLRQLQRKKSHVAVVLDEYGGTYGIVTMEDILEELVGDIWDEHDEITETFNRLNDNSFRVDASVDFEDFCEFFDIEADTDKVSLSGWVTEMLGKIPKSGDSFQYERLLITVLSIASHRVSEVSVEVLPDILQNSESNSEDEYEGNDGEC